MAKDDRTRVVIVGAKGRMGQALVRLAEADPQLELIAGLDRGDSVSEVIARADVLVEFAHHSATAPLAALAATQGKALVIGTTGHTAEEKRAIKQAAKTIPVVFAPNFSIGINLLFHLARVASLALDESYDREIIEMHHRHKLDAPSGTARRLGDILAETMGGNASDLLRHGREGEVGARGLREIGMHALRGGDVVGDHTVIFAAEGERLELTHRASNRDTFAVGALRAARWVRTQSPSLYSMQDVLGLK
jgi:4-hydroxy-tetrahydrodipicolinate reductase